MIRRTVVLIAALSAVGLSGDFWNTKAPAQWSEKETQQILSSSPWARQAKTEFRARGERPGQGEMRPPEGGGPPMGGGERGPGPGMGGPGMGGPMGPPEFKAAVRWESALPVQDALKQKLPQEYVGYYVIAVEGLPQMRRPPMRRREGGPQMDQDQMRKRMMERMKENTLLALKGNDSLKPERIETRASGESSIFLFFFPRGEAPFALEDKELTFSTVFGPMEVKASFPLKDMVYRGKLEL
ncbi:MAG: hypothetical protein LLG20_12380 [Acidobacteriales bacterium]|nr:hypothetical protein [Terriglobales bacterium]